MTQRSRKTAGTQVTATPATQYTRLSLPRPAPPQSRPGATSHHPPADAARPSSSPMWPVRTSHSCHGQRFLTLLDTPRLALWRSQAAEGAGRRPAWAASWNKKNKSINHPYSCL